jgi:Domain of unknown function (DUF4383)
VLFVAAGIVGFFYNGTFTSNEAVHDDMFGIFSVNGWGNALDILLGVVGLSVASSWWGARTYAYGVGALLIGLAVWGFILGQGQSILSIIPVNSADNVAHLLLGIAGIFAAVASPAEPAPTTIPAAS